MILIQLVFVVKIKNILMRFYCSFTKLELQDLNSLADGNQDINKYDDDNEISTIVYVDFR